MTQDTQAGSRKGDEVSPRSASGEAERYPITPRRYGRAVFCLFLIVAVCGVTVPVLLANNGRNLQILGDRIGLPLNDWWRGKTQRVSRPADHAPMEAAVIPPHHPIPVPAIVDPPSPLLPPVKAWEPEQDCNALEPRATGEKPVFLIAPDGASECTVLIALSEAERASSLFLQLRAAGDRLSSLRMKLNFGADEEAAALTQKAGELARKILAPLSENDRRYLQGKMTERQGFRSEIGDWRITFRGEGNDASRFNLIAVSKGREPAVAGGADSVDP